MTVVEGCHEIKIMAFSLKETNWGWYSGYNWLRRVSTWYSLTPRTKTSPQAMLLQWSTQISVHNICGDCDIPVRLTFQQAKQLRPGHGVISKRTVSVLLGILISFYVHTYISRIPLALHERRDFLLSTGTGPNIRGIVLKNVKSGCKIKEMRASTSDNLN